MANCDPNTMARGADLKEIAEQLEIVLDANKVMEKRIDKLEAEMKSFSGIIKVSSNHAASSEFDRVPEASNESRNNHLSSTEYSFKTAEKEPDLTLNFGAVDKSDSSSRSFLDGILDACQKESSLSELRKINDSSNNIEDVSSDEVSEGGGEADSSEGGECFQLTNNKDSEIERPNSSSRSFLGGILDASQKESSLNELREINNIFNSVEREVSSQEVREGGREEDTSEDVKSTTEKDKSIPDKKRVPTDVTERLRRSKRNKKPPKRLTMNTSCKGQSYMESSAIVERRRPSRAVCQVQ